MSDATVKHPENLALLIQWITMRHGIHYRRHVLQQKPPWTTNEVMANTFFTNVYRELDPGTQWLVQHVRQNQIMQLGPHYMDTLLNVLMYRMALNERSKAALGWIPLAHFDSGEVRGVLRHMAGKVGVFTSAYLVSNHGSKANKIDVVCDSFLRIADTLDQRGDELIQAPDRKAWVEWCARNLYGIGPFVAFQALVDLCYPEIQVLSWSNDGWCCTGPGSKRGLQLIFGGHERADERITWLCEHINPQLEELGVHGWADHDATCTLLGGACGCAGALVPISRANMQNCLCELSKYHRALQGKGTKRKFRPVEARVRDREALGHGKQLEMPW